MKFQYFMKLDLDLLTYNNINHADQLVLQLNFSDISKTCPVKHCQRCCLDGEKFSILIFLLLL